MSLQKLYNRYNEDIEFMVVYIKEAHAQDEWWLGETKLMRLGFELGGALANTELFAPTTDEERLKNATKCKNRILGDLPTYVDGIDNAVNDAYAALPTRIYLIAKDGTVAWDSGLGPFGFIPDDLETAIKQYLSENM